ncbi:uncharacterized protein LOC131432681 [Malaya genurostris]|uniref:uncharacterized protein LOC131432681 n=1 Tax=Malaya genurostris TaxID=325434 RepID=UPI0026F3B2A2|nr:uncharacterized protein LOC131432681 [Malaya genurostris]
MKWLLLTVLLYGLATAAKLREPSKRVPMGELAERTEEFRVAFDELHTEKDGFVQITRLLSSGELHLLNRASLTVIGHAWSNITNHFNETLESIDSSDGAEDCLEELREEILAEQIRAADEMSECAAFKIQIKEGLSDEFRALGNTLQIISTMAAEYTLYTFAIHNSFIESADHLDWLERNFELQRNFWDTTARIEAQADLDAIEANRPALIKEFTECLSHIPEVLDEFNEDILTRLEQC